MMYTESHAVDIAAVVSIAVPSAVVWGVVVLMILEVEGQAEVSHLYS